MKHYIRMLREETTRHIDTVRRLGVRLVTFDVASMDSIDDVPEMFAEGKVEWTARGSSQTWTWKGRGALPQALGTKEVNGLPKKISIGQIDIFWGYGWEVGAEWV